MARRDVRPVRRRGTIELIGGGILVVVAIGVTVSIPDTSVVSASRFLLVYMFALVAALAIAAGGTRLDRRIAQPVTRDVRRWIYGGLATAFGLGFALCTWKVVPSRLPSATLHLASVPVFTLVMAIGTLVGKRFGWWLAIVGGSIVLLSTILLIARILASAAFLAGVYGAFGKGAATFALIAVALVVELVALLPICQVKFLMSRRGRRAYGV